MSTKVSVMLLNKSLSKMVLNIVLPSCFPYMVPSDFASIKLLCTLTVPISITSMSVEFQLCGTNMIGAPASMFILIRDERNAVSLI